MVALSSSSREGQNPAIRARVFSISAFDSDWYLEVNGISGVPINKAWSHYRSIGQGRGFRARYDVAELVRTLISEQVGSTLGAVLQKQIPSGMPVWFYPENLPGQGRYLSSTLDPYYAFAECFGRELRQLNAYGKLLNLRAMLRESSDDPNSANGCLLHVLESIMLPAYAAIEQRREHHGNGWHANYANLSAQEISGVEICFDSEFYLGAYSDIRMSGVNPLGHFLSQGRLEGRQCTPIFDPFYYLSENPDVEAAGVDPFVHYIMHGWRERRNPSEAFPHIWLERVFPEALKHPHGFCGYLGREVSGEQKLQMLHSNFNSSSNPDFRPRPGQSSPAGDHDSFRVFAFYLTQYHPIAQNDLAWGKGFTEWRNVTKAFPRHFGHYQPKLPTDSTLYDLRILDNIIDHVEMARQHGVNGFCFYYYWFSGERVLEQPLDLFLAAAEQANFPFCILWANENWTRKWDGQSKDVIIGQKYLETDALQFIRDVEPILLDPRYERVNDAPLLIVYRPDDLPDCQDWVDTWRRYWRDQGHGELHLVCVQFLPDTNPEDYGFDAMLQFPPNGFPNHGTHQKIARYTRSFSGNLYSYDEMQWRAMVQQYPHPVYRTSVPSWDNECRRPQQGDQFVGSSPAKFRDWTASNLFHSKRDNEAHLSFINAWNEWAESACLEPDSRYGYAHLEALADARAIASVQSEAELWVATHSCAIVIHVFYLDTFQSIAGRLERYEPNCDLYITLPPLGCNQKIAAIRQRFPRARFFIADNRGRDVLPFLSLIQSLNARRLQYDYICKLHTKKSPHRRDGNAWLDEMVNCLLPMEGHQRIKELFQPGVGMLIPRDHAVSLREFMGGNEGLLDVILNAHGALDRKNESSYFSSGTMFWVHGEVLRNLSTDEHAYRFEYERSQVDGTLAHAWERAMTLLVQARGLRCLQSDGTEVRVAAPGTYRFANLEGRVDLGGSVDRRTADVVRSLQRSAAAPQERVAILATFVRNKSDVDNVRRLGTFLRSNGFFVACINPEYDYSQTVSDDQLLDHLCCDLYVERRNNGYDFGSWAEGFFFLKGRGELHSEVTQELLIINDSCILTDVNSDLITKARQIPVDVVGLTDSQQFLHHVQSNFMLIRRFQHCDTVLDSFFTEYLGRSLQSKDDVIQYGELALARKFEQMQIQWKPVFEMQQLVAITLKNYADSPADSWERHTADKLAEGQQLNPHHYMHEALYLQLGCPLIKKELLRDNPSGYPGIDRYRQAQLR